MDFPAKENCLKCGTSIKFSTIDLHPSYNEEAIQELTCEKCGHVMFKTISLKPKPREGK